MSHPEPSGGMRVTLDRAAAVAVMQRGGWRHQVPLVDLPRWRAMSVALRARGAKRGESRGPWAKFYEADVVALDAACRELDGGGNGS